MRECFDQLLNIDDIAPSHKLSIWSSGVLTLVSVTAYWSVQSLSEKRDKKVSRAVDLEDLEKDYALTKARMQLAHSEVKHLNIGEYKLNALFFPDMMDDKRDVGRIQEWNLKPKSGHELYLIFNVIS